MPYSAIDFLVGVAGALGTELPDGPVFAVLGVEEAGQEGQGVAVGARGVGGRGSGGCYYCWVVSLGWVGALVGGARSVRRRIWVGRWMLSVQSRVRLHVLLSVT